MNSNTKVCAIVVTYNRKELLIECLKSLEKQDPLLSIYLVDNASTDGTPELLLEDGYIDELPPVNWDHEWERKYNHNHLTLYYLKLKENTGGAGGFYEGLKRAYKEGYDWFWLMDDDSEPTKDCLSSLIEYKDAKNVSGLCSKVLGVDNSIITASRGYFNFKGIPLQEYVPEESYQNQCLEIDMCSFVGLLVPENAVKRIGFPNKDFFIHADDLDYSIRLREIGRILLITSSTIIHKDEYSKKSFEKRRIYRKSKRYPYNQLWLNYFYPRNITWIGVKYGKNRLRLYFEVMIKLLGIIMGIIIYDDHKIRRINFVKEAYIDGLKGNFDNKKPKKLLYD